jgi:fructoselysine 6-kinase
VFARRFGAITSYVGAVGQDAAGNAIRAALAEEGVITERLRVLPGPTAYCVVGHRQGDRVFLKFDLGVSIFVPDEGDFEFVRSFDAVHIGQSSGLDAYLERFSAEVRLSYDFSTRRNVAHRELITPRCFLASFSGGDLDREDGVALLRQALAAGAEWCLVTRGEHGAFLGTGDQLFETPAVSVDVVDTLGAGDSFTARTLMGLLSGEAPRDTLHAATQAAAETCTHLGAVGHAVPIAIDVSHMWALEDEG